MAIETLGAALRQINRLFADGVVEGLSDAQLLERFLFHGDAVAFEALLGRHGPMVLSVCRGILRDPHDAEDAFQATFLVLVRTGGTIRGGDALGGWLHRVAHRVANQANVAAARRRRLEREVGQMPVATSTTGRAGSHELLPALHEEIARLPEKYRLAIVHCDLEGMTQSQAAGQLHWRKRTLQHRLAQGRARLRRRLARRGLAPDGATLGAVLLREARAAVPAGWSQSTVRSAVATANHALTAGVVSAAAKELTQEVFRLMVLKKLRFASATLLTAGLIAWGASAALVSLGQGPSQEPAAKPDLALQQRAETAVPQPEPNPLVIPGKVTFRGRVLAPDGRPVRGAKLYMTLAWGYPHEPSPSPEYATTGPDGRFRFAVPEAEFGDQYTVVAATAPNYGAGWVAVPALGQRDDLTIRLVEDDVPITGQIIDLEGQPVPGATLRLMQINAAPGEDLGPWLEAVKAKKGERLALEQRYLKRFTIAVPLQVTTDSAGRFRLAGIGRNRLVAVQLDGPTIVSEHLHMLTRPGEPGDPRRVDTYYGADFRHAAAPSKPIVGVVRDADTEQPLAGVTIRSSGLATDRKGVFRGFDLVQTMTDAQGRYRLTGMPKRAGSQIVAIPGRDQPHVSTHTDIPDSPGLDPVTADIELKRGVWIEGKITDKVTGQPLRGRVEYFALSSNPNLRDFAGFDGTFPFIDSGVQTKEDGSYRFVGLPGPGWVAVWYVGDYLRAPDRDDEYGTKESSLSTAPYHAHHTINYGALARIDPPKGVDSVTRDVTLDPGRMIKGTVLGPDGQPLAGARRFFMGIGRSYWERDRMKTAEFTGWFNPRRPDVLFHHPEKGLVGVAPRPKEKGSFITVRLEPGAAVTGRLVGAGGRPRAGVELEVSFHPKGWEFWIDYPPRRITTDPEGRFRVAGLVPGYEFRLSDGKGELSFGDILRSGQTKDLGDGKMKAEDE
jgi:RNA polymerase sigma factor (sigma-70 family)